MSTKRLLELFYKLIHPAAPEPTDTKQVVPKQEVITNRRIEDFPGRILNFGGTETELNRLVDRYPQDTGNTPIQNQIYTVNINPSENPDLVADMGSKENLAGLPDNRFDVVYFSGVPARDINLEQAFETAARVLKEDGILFFMGGARVFGIDIPELLALSDFRQGRPLKELMPKKGGGLELAAASGDFIIASKSTQPIDLNKIYQELPIMKAIVGDSTQLPASAIAAEFSSYGKEEEKSESPRLK